MTLGRGEMEPAPINNNLGWRTEAAIFSRGGKMHLFVTVWEFERGRPCEVFLACSKAESDTDKFLREEGKMCSRLLQAGMPVAVLIQKLKGEVGPLEGETDYPGVPTCSGVQDLLAHILERRYLVRA